MSASTKFSWRSEGITKITEGGKRSLRVLTVCQTALTATGKYMGPLGCILRKGVPQTPLTPALARGAEAGGQSSLSLRPAWATE